ncbi:MAG: aminotransferase class V-fold PLP-dependent enzyme, partial [Planctomycetota bacterium]|nr:aminotransferase class V-fold PLP-dependent enzyme [Planctomycetota bacterium]
MTAADLPAILGGSPAFPAGAPRWPPDDPHVRAALDRAAADGTWGVYHGPHCEALKQSLAEYHAVEFVELCCSGTAAIELALRGLRIVDGDEVIMAAYDFKANFQNVLVVGATPVLVDLRSDDRQMDLKQLDAARTEQTKVVIASHLHGGLVDMPNLMAWAGQHGIAVIEDACQCPGAMIAGRKAGMWGDVGAHSFGGSKLLTAGRGGAVMTNDSAIHQRIRLYVARGNDAYPLSELQAIVLAPQLTFLDERNVARTRNARALAKHLSATGLTAFAQASENSPAYYKLGLMYDPAAFSGLPRERFVDAIQAEGIAMSAGFRALHRIHSKRRFRQVGDLPFANDTDERIITLHHPILGGDDTDLTSIANAVERI